MTTKTVIIGCWLGMALALTLPGCEISNCEKGAFCGDGNDGAGSHEEHEQCIAYCGRVSVCGGSQADDFDECVEGCEDRFEVLPELTAELCRCAEWSTCEDVNEGRCSDPDTGGSGGSSAGGSSAGGSSAGGAHLTGGSSAGGSSAGGSSAGGAHATGGSSSSGGASAGGAPSTGGSGGAQCPTGGTSSGGTDAGGAGGEGAACDCDCDCTAPQTCVEGYCAG
jgi:hypothetical protein